MTTATKKPKKMVKPADAEKTDAEKAAEMAANPHMANLAVAIVEHAEKKVEEIQDKALAETIDVLRGQTLEMSFTVHGLPKTRRITGQMADQIAKAVGGKRKGVRSSWGMFSSSHPAVAALNSAIRDLTNLRDGWSIVRSAEVKKGDEGLAIEGGKRLIWDKDVDEFYKLFAAAAEKIDAAAKHVQYAMDHETTGYDQKNEEIRVPSVKAMDKENAGDAWEEAAYPADVTKVAGVAKERDADGNPVLGADGKPKYVIAFEEYHVSEKLPKLLQERAEERIRQSLNDTVETAMSYAVAELMDAVSTFKDELTNKVLLRPKVGGEYEYLTAHGDCQMVRAVTSDQDAAVPVGHVRVYVRYKAEVDGAKVTVGKWLGPVPVAEYQVKLRPEATGEKKKIYPTVIEGIISQMQAFRDKKAKMLGAYGQKAVEAFAPLLKELTRYKDLHASNEEAAKKLAAALKGSAEKRQDVADTIGAAMEALESQVEEVKKAVRRRTIRRI